MSKTDDSQHPSFVADSRILLNSPTEVEKSEEIETEIETVSDKEHDTNHDLEKASDLEEHGLEKKKKCCTIKCCVIFTFIAIVVIIVSGVVFAYTCQSFFMYPGVFSADKDKMVTPAKAIDINYVAEDGVKLHAYFVTPDSSRGSNETMIFCQGNAGNIAKNWYGFGLDLGEEMRCNVFMLSYRGFGKSEGLPDEEGIKKDMEAAIKYVTQNYKLVGFFGVSLGGAVASYGAHYCMSMSIPISFLVLANTFTSMVREVQDLVPIVPECLISQKWDTLKLAQNFRNFRCLIFAGEDDKLIDPRHSRELHAAIKGSKLVMIPEAGHLDFVSHVFWDNISGKNLKWLLPERYTK